MSGRTQVGVLVSGAGTNLVALLEACRHEGFPAKVALVLCNRRDAGALEACRHWGVAHDVVPIGDFGGDAAARDRALRDRFRDAGVTLVVCAGYNRVLSDEFLAAFPDAILNVHPSLLPAFGGGMNAVEEALAHGAKISGCTVQLLAPGDVDGGPIISQAAVAVEEDDDAESLRQRIHEQEWRLLPEAVALWASGRLRREGAVVRILPAATPTAAR